MITTINGYQAEDSETPAIILNGRPAEDFELAAIARAHEGERVKELELLAGVLTSDVIPQWMEAAAA